MILEKITANRVLVEADLAPVQGDRFQPTGFADLGAAFYTLPDDTPMLLVESAQSMANRLEQTILTPDGELVKDVEGLSYVCADLTGEGVPKVRVSSLTEAHRLASPYLILGEDISDKHTSFSQIFKTEAESSEKGKLDWPRIHATLFKYDVNSLLHGVFLANLDGGRIRVPRLISAFIEARNAREVVSGGAKKALDPGGTIRHAAAPQKDVFGNVIYQRSEYVAERITAYFNLDAASIRRLGLPEAAQELLACLGLYKMRLLLEGDLRLRTACDLRLKGEINVTEGMAALPDAATLLKALQAAIAACRGLFADPPVTLLTVPATVVKKKEGKKKDEDKTAGDNATDGEADDDAAS